MIQNAWFRYGLYGWIPFRGRCPRITDYSPHSMIRAKYLQGLLGGEIAYYSKQFHVDLAPVTMAVLDAQHWLKVAGDEPYGMPSVDGASPAVFVMPASWKDVTWMFVPSREEVPPDMLRKALANGKKCRFRSLGNGRNRRQSQTPAQWRSGMTPEKLVAEMDGQLRATLIGLSNSWTMPIKGRIDMLSTGIRTPIRMKVFGPDLTVIGRILTDVEATFRTVRGTRSAFAERVSQGYHLDSYVNRQAIARYGGFGSLPSSLDYLCGE